MRLFNVIRFRSPDRQGRKVYCTLLRLQRGLAASERHFFFMVVDFQGSEVVSGQLRG